MSELIIFNQFGKGTKTEKARTGNCVIYTRVSTKEQADNNMSLQTQRRYCEQFATKSGYTIMGYFGGTYESAQTDERKEFNNMLSFVKKSREKISYIIVYSVDRFSRSGANAIYIAQQLKKEGVTIISVTQPTDTTTASGSLQQNIQFIFSEYDNQLRREKCITGIKEALLRGDWCQAAPIGYERGKINGKKSWVVNEHGKLLRKAFMWKATEMVSNEEARERLAKLGLQISHQQMSSIFRNPFYCGLLSHNLLEGQVVEGNHEKLISREIFLKVNEVQNRNAYGYTTTEENDAIPLKRFLRCEYCGSFLRGYIVKAKGIWYYKCNTKGCNCNRNAEEMHSKFTDILDHYTLKSEPLVPLVEQQMLATYYKYSGEEKDDRLVYEKAIKEIDVKIEKQKRRLEDEEIPYAIYLEFVTKYEKEKKKVAEEIEKGSKGVSSPLRCVQFAVNYSCKLKPVWTSASYTAQQKLQFLLFPEGIFYNRAEDKCRTDNINPAFACVAELERLLQKCESRTSQKNFDSAAWVASPRIERGS